MAKITFILAFIIISMSTLYSQEDPCCKMSAIDKFASFGEQQAFRDAHPEPIPFTLLNPAGEMVTFSTPDGKTGSAYQIKGTGTSSKYILMFHEWYGLNDYIKQEADALQAELGDVTVLALDLYDGKVAANSDEASKYVKEVSKERAVNIINGAIDYTGSNQIGTIGWCFGGGWSLQSAILLGDKSKATVMYYGMPESDTSRLAMIKAPVLGIFALQDQNITPAVVSKFEENMKQLNKTITIKSYDAVHAFANPSNPKHDPEATKDAWGMTVKFFKENL
ncbi:MAG: dienelactone hydrolase family protein [Ignavibacteriae bacterium]|nr:MAG: dienelactone hydrolase family protein [Ignavibacteriota bacterium]